MRWKNWWAVRKISGEVWGKCWKGGETAGVSGANCCEGGETILEVRATAWDVEKMLGTWGDCCGIGGNF